MIDFTVQLPVNLLSAGQFVARPHWLHPRRRLDSSVLIVVERGSFVIGIEETPVRMEPGQAVLLPAGCLHYGISTDEGVAPAYCWAHFVDGKAVNPPHRLTLPLHTNTLPEAVYARTISLLRQLINDRAFGAPSGLS